MGVLARLKHILRPADPVINDDLERAIADRQLGVFQAAILQNDL
jgi:hypothetical protein